MGKFSFLNVLVDIVDGIGKMLNKKWVVLLDNHKIRLKLVKPDDMKKYNYDDRYFVNGNIYYKDKANPIKPIMDEKEDELDLISSDRYKHDMANTVLQKIQSEESEGWTTRKLALLGMMFTLVNTGVIAIAGLLFLG